MTDDDSVGEYGDGSASLTAQNRALQADLADKTRYIQTLEKRLMQARRASSSRTSVGFSTPNKGIMVGEDHSVSTLLREKDAEIAELRARLDDKDRMLAALRSAARSREVAEGAMDGRTSALYEHSPPPTINPPPAPSNALAGRSNSLTARSNSLTNPRTRTKSVDEVNQILDEMIQDRVETGHLVRGVRGSVRVASDRKLETHPENSLKMEPLRKTASFDDGNRASAVQA